MSKNSQVDNMPSWLELLLGVVVCSAMALVILYYLAKNYYVDSWIFSISLGFLIPAAIFGFVSRRMFLGTLGAPFIGLAGAMGFLLGSPGKGISLLTVAICGSAGGLICVIVSGLSGLICDICFNKKAPDETPPPAEDK